MKHIITTVMLLMLSLAALPAQFSVDLEAGLAFTSYNDVRIPNNNTSSKFSFNDDLESEPLFAYRVNLHYHINERHRLTLFYAPLTILPTGTFDRDIRFQGETFPEGVPIKGEYRFDSYRLQYRYYFRNQDKFYKAIGLTGKIRDAEISLESEDLFATKKNTGFVPIINFLLEQKITEDMDIILDGDALFSPFGRAADVLLALNYDINDRYSLRGGYRILEGGSDVDEVYTFALINYFVLNMRIRL